MAEGPQQVPIDTKYLPELMAEKDSIDPSFVHAVRLISSEINKIKNPHEEKSSTSSEKELLDANGGRPTKVSLCIKVPIDRYPSFNFVGRLLGPGGSTLKGIQSTTSTQIAILGKGSMRDKKKAEELAAGGDSKYQHLNYPLHVRITSVSSLDQAYIQIGHAATEIIKLMQPTQDDETDPSIPGRGSQRGGMMRGRGRGGGGGRGSSARGASRGGRGGAAQRGGAAGRGRGAAGAGRGYAAKTQDPYAAVQQSYDYSLEGYDAYGAEYADVAYDPYAAEATAYDPYAVDATYAEAATAAAYADVSNYGYSDASYDAYGNGAETAGQYAAPAAKPYRGKMRGGGGAAGRGRAAAKPY